MSAASHPTTIKTLATCANCSSTYELVGCYNSKTLTIEQCSKCHQAFTGVKQQKSTGASENFYKKFKFNINNLKG